MDGADQPNLFVSYGGSFGDLSVLFGVGYHFAKDTPDEDWQDGAQPINVGLGVQYSTDSFGVKFRAVGGFAGDDKTTRIIADVLPYFNLGDNLVAYVSAGIGMRMPDGGDTVLGWHFNPYIRIGEEWGSHFLAGIKVYSSNKDGAYDYDNDNKAISWAIPIALVIGF
jgi:hypothetical protein